MLPSPARTLIAATLILASAAPVLALGRGRAFDRDKRFRLNATVGRISPIEGFVQETTRPLFEVTGQPDRQSAAESFSFEEVGIRDSDTTFGLSLEYPWKYVTLQVDGSFMRAEARGVASRDFFIGVEEIAFDGRSYEYQAILEGSEYQADLDATLVGLRTLVTPVTFNPGGAAQFVPWVSAGLFVFAGEFNVNAGPALGVQLYERPVREYVTNGSGRGEAFAFVPEVGLGGELRLRLFARAAGDASLVLQGGYSVFEFRGSTSDLGISARNEKDLDVAYDSYDGRAVVEWPLSRRVNLIAGAEIRTISTDAVSAAQQRSVDDTLARREKFDKDINLELTSVNAIFGLRW